MAKAVVLLLVLVLSVFLNVAWCVTCPKENEEDDAIYLPHETECGKFYECYHGNARLFVCPPGTYFDTTLDVCSFDVDCGNLVTSTKPPPTTETTVVTETETTEITETPIVTGTTETAAPDPTTPPELPSTTDALKTNIF